MTILDDEAQKIAALAVKLAHEKFDIEFDYSAQSLSKLDSLLQKANLYFMESKKAGKPVEEGIKKNARIWGIYFGEIVKRELGIGIWVKREDELLLILNNFEISPINQIYSCLTSPQSFSLVSSLDFWKNRISDDQNNNLRAPVASVRENTQQYINPIGENLNSPKGARPNYYYRGAPLSIVCPQCMSLIHSDAQVCPYCHKRLKGDSPWIKYVILAVVIILIIVVISDANELLNSVGKDPLFP
jgi:hypothetical protein